VGNDKGNQDNNRFKTYISIALLVMIIFVGMNKFGFTKGTDVIKTGGGGLGDIALEYYFEKYPEQVENKDVEAVVQNFGCHKEIYIYKNGNRVMRMSYSNGKIYELN